MMKMNYIIIHYYIPCSIYMNLQYTMYMNGESPFLLLLHESTDINCVVI